MRNSSLTAQRHYGYPFAVAISISPYSDLVKILICSKAELAFGCINIYLIHYLQKMYF